MDQELQPCPFCGSDAVYVQNAGWQANTFVRCKGCNTEFGLDDGTPRAHDQTVAAWNRRSLSASTSLPALPFAEPMQLEPVIIADEWKAKLGHVQFMTDEGIRRIRFVDLQK